MTCSISCPTRRPAWAALLRKILPSAFRGYRQRFGIEGIHVHDTITLMAILYPELFVAQEMAGDVETMGELTTGMTVFDRHRIPARQYNMEVAMDLEKEKVIEKIIRGLNRAAGREGDAKGRGERCCRLSVVSCQLSVEDRRG